MRNFVKTIYSQTWDESCMSNYPALQTLVVARGTYKTEISHGYGVNRKTVELDNDIFDSMINICKLQIDAGKKPSDSEAQGL